MRWEVSVDGKKVGFVNADTHDNAVKKARFGFHLSNVPDSRVQVEPADEEGKCHDDRHYSQSGPVLSQEDL